MPHDDSINVETLANTLPVKLVLLSPLKLFCPKSKIDVDEGMEEAHGGVVNTMFEQSSVAPLTLHVGAEHAAALKARQASAITANSNGHFSIGLQRGGLC